MARLPDFIQVGPHRVRVRYRRPEEPLGAVPETVHTQASCARGIRWSDLAKEIHAEREGTG